MSSSPPSNNGNTLVADAEYRASLDAMSTRMSQLASFCSDISTKELYSQAEESVKNSTGRMINVVDNEEYYAHQMKQVNAMKVVEYDASTLDASTFDDLRDEEEELQDTLSDLPAKQGRHLECFDEATIIDAEACKRAEELRQEIRSASQALVEYGTSTKAKALNLAEQEIAITASTVQECAEIEVEQMFPIKMTESDTVLEKGHHVVEMVARIQDMTDELRKIDNYLSGEKLSEFTQSVYNIESSTGPVDAVASLNQTEKAIVSRENEIPAAPPTPTEILQATSDTTHAEEGEAQTRFAYYVSQV